MHKNIKSESSIRTLKVGTTGLQPNFLISKLVTVRTLYLMKALCRSKY